MALEFSHEPVMKEEAVSGLRVRPDGIYADGTMGGAGHSSAIAEGLKNGRLYCFDRDPEAIAAGGKRLEPFGDRVSVIRANYKDMVRILKDRGVSGLDGILLDLGVSSHQIDDPDRGFSYMIREAALDMRMDLSQEFSAYDVVNSYPRDELKRILREYGEERYAGRIAANIEKARRREPVATVGSLVDIIERSIPGAAKKSGHPAKRTFQAIRIEVNRELEELGDHLSEMIRFLNPGGRMAVISFHSLEDRTVKTTFNTCEDPCVCPKDFPVCVCGRKSLGHRITKKPLTAGEDELKMNPRAGSAKLRIFERSVP